MASDPRINDLSEAVEALASAIGELAMTVANDPAKRTQALTARRIAQEAERMAERVLVNP